MGRSDIVSDCLRGEVCMICLGQVKSGSLSGVGCEITWIRPPL